MEQHRAVSRHDIALPSGLHPSQDGSDIVADRFQDWPQDCQWSKASGHCRGRAPAPMERIVGQIQLAAKVLEPQQRGQIVAWEWTSCLR